MATQNGSAIVSGAASIVASGHVPEGLAVVSGSASVIAVPEAAKAAAALLTGIMSVVPSAQKSSPCYASLVATSSASAAGSSISAGQVSMSCEATTEVLPQRITYTSAAVTGSATIDADARSVYYDTLLEDSRQIRPLLKVYFDAEATEFEYDDILSLQLLEEYHNINTDYLAVGGISTLELEVVLENTHHDFDLDKATSPYYGKLVPEKKVELIMQVNTTEGWVDVVMGTYYVAYWDDSAYGQVTLVAYDQLYFRGNQPLAEIPVAVDISLYSLFDYVLSATGMTHSIDSRLNITVPYGTLPVGTVREVLEHLAMACCCNVTVTRDDEIKVMLVEGTPIGSIALTGDDCIISANTPTMLNNIYSSTNIKKATASIVDNEIVLSLTKLTLPNGTTTLTNQTFSNGPIMKVVQVKTSNDESITVNVKRVSAWSIDLEFINSSSEQVVDVTALGDKVVYSYQNNSVAVDSPVITDKPYELEHNLMQNASLITNLETLIGGWVGDSKRKIVLESRGHPMIELGCALTVTEARQQITNVKTYVARHLFEYSGGVTSNIECIRVEE